MNQNNNSRQNESVINEREDEQLDQLVQAFNTLAVQNTNALQEVTKTTSMLIQAINNIQEQNKFQQQMMMSMMRQTTMLVEGVMHPRQINEGNERIVNFQSQPVVQNPSNVQNPIGPLNFPSLRSTQESLLFSSQSNTFFENNVSRSPISAPPVPAFHSTPIVRSQGILSDNMEIQNVIERDFDFYGVSLGYQSQVNISIFGLADKTKIVTWGVKNSPRAHDDFNHMKAFFKMSRTVYESLHNSQFFAKKEVIFPETSDYLSQFYQWQNDLRKEEVVKKYIGPDRQALVKDFYHSCEYANYSICSENEFFKFPIAKLLLDEVDLLRGTMESKVMRIGQIITNSRNL